MGVSTRARSGVRDDEDDDEDDDDADGRSCEEIGQISPDSSETSEARKAARLQRELPAGAPAPEEAEIVGSHNGCCSPFSSFGVWGWSITRVNGNSRNPKSRPRYSQSRNLPQAAGWKPDVGPEP